MKHPLWGIAVCLILAGCTSLGKSGGVDNSCNVKCKLCTDMEVKCKGGVDTEQDTTTQGTISGPTVQ